MLTNYCLNSMAPDYTFAFRVLVRVSEHSDLSPAYRFMSLIYGLGTLTTNFFSIYISG